MYQTFLVQYHAAIMFSFNQGMFNDLTHWFEPRAYIYRLSVRDQRCRISEGSRRIHFGCKLEYKQPKIMVRMTWGKGKCLLSLVKLKDKVPVFPLDTARVCVVAAKEWRQVSRAFSRSAASYPSTKRYTMNNMLYLTCVAALIVSATNQP